MSYTFCEGRVECPYNRAHKVSQLRALQHVMKCRKQHPHLTEAIVICPYNQAHHVPVEDIKLHFQSCREYAAFHMYEATSSTAASSVQPVQKRLGEDCNSAKAGGWTTSLVDPPGSEVDDDLAEWM